VYWFGFGGLNEPGEGSRLQLLCDNLCSGDGMFPCVPKDVLALAPANLPPITVRFTPQRFGHSRSPLSLSTHRVVNVQKHQGSRWKAVHVSNVAIRNVDGGCAAGKGKPMTSDLALLSRRRYVNTNRHADNGVSEAYLAPNTQRLTQALTSPSHARGNEQRGKDALRNHEFLTDHLQTHFRYAIELLMPT
jgi:hypothetical protein